MDLTMNWKMTKERKSGLKDKSTENYPTRIKEKRNKN